MIINGENLVLGRLASYVSKQVMRGEKVDVVNCEKVIITGNKESILKDYRERDEIGSVSKGPFYPRMPDRFVRRVIRGMLAYKQPRGREAFDKTMCYIGVPNEFKDKKLESIKEAHLDTKRTTFITVGELCRIRWGKKS